ncbi:transglycosylase domain-containing protein [Oceanirhabdus sp. W0125-5]|uniref:transglycosylase domain-containing protein n=1 Tax=Oceanirhabdus sp. W0125-5 TaxID=2999116 RepID=UPI0022F34129|nr:biosynthetic peptidoglycan transglycosylase [Oceanirhabdus sp. W0125-5]WBW94713.1 transglycosylase domain-containing protein [Oceanirhabdus sp. W0125-5]
MRRKILIFLLVFISFTCFNICGLKEKCIRNNVKNLKRNIIAHRDDYVTMDKLPINLKKAIISVEDKNFYSHIGFDPLAIGRAFINNAKAGQIVEGGSTITQQLAKNAFLSNERTYTRKLKELALSIQLELTYSKEEILEMYLNFIYFGENTYGVQAASKKYFNKDIWDLNLEESALLAGIPQSPNTLNPIINKEKALWKRDIVLDSMVKNGFIDSYLCKKSRDTLDVSLVPHSPNYSKERIVSIESRYLTPLLVSISKSVTTILLPPISLPSL